jgi:hypothetical protein
MALLAFSAHGWMMIWKGITVTVGYQFLSAFPVLPLFSPPAYLVLLLCSLCKGQDETLMCSLWRERGVELFIYLPLPGPRAKDLKLSKMTQGMITSVRTSVGSMY